MLEKEEERLKGFFSPLCAWGVGTVQLQRQFAADLLVGGKEAQWEAP